MNPFRVESSFQTIHSKWNNLPSWKKNTAILAALTAVTGVGLYYAGFFSQSLPEKFREDRLVKEIEMCLYQFNNFPSFYSKEGSGTSSSASKVTVNFSEMVLNNSTLKSITEWLPQKISEFAVSCFEKGGRPYLSLICQNSVQGNGTLSGQANCVGVSESQFPELFNS